MEENNHTPIIIGNCRPFRIIERETDNWNASLKEINENEYDYVKLNRMSTFIDIGIAPFSLGIGYDGSLVLPATKDFANKENSLEKFNQTLGILLLGGIYSESVQPDNISYGTLFFNGYIKIHGGSSGLIAGFHKSIRSKLVGTMDSIKLLEPKSISVSDLKNAYRKGKNIFDKIPNLSPNMLLDGTSHYVRNQWSESLIFLWTSIEQLVNQIWKSKVMRNSFASSVIVGDYLYGFDKKTLRCVNLKTQKSLWGERGLGEGSLMYADGHLIVLSERGKLLLVEATHTGYVEKAQTQILKGRCWTVPTLANGKLYVRNQKDTLCLDFAEK